MNTAAVILAGGASRRMGRPKALLIWGGETFLNRQVRMFSKIADPVIVVLGHSADEIKGSLSHPAIVVYNPDPERGMLSSLQCGVERVPTSAESFLFTPLDYPRVQQTTLRSLVSGLRSEARALIAIPRHEGRKGHPVICRKQIAGEILALPLEAQARDAIRCHEAATLYVDVDDPGILEDIDDPESYARLQEAEAGV